MLDCFPVSSHGVEHGSTLQGSLPQSQLTFGASALVQIA